MRIMLVQWIIAALSLLGTAYVLPGFVIGGFGSALLAAVVIGFANLTIRPVLLLLTLPINILTLGLFTWVVNAIVLKICAALTPGFEIKTWGTAFLAAIVIALITIFIYWLLGGY